MSPPQPRRRTLSSPPYGRCSVWCVWRPRSTPAARFSASRTSASPQAKTWCAAAAPGSSSATSTTAAPRLRPSRSSPRRAVRPPRRRASSSPPTPRWAKPDWASSRRRTPTAASDIPEYATIFTTPSGTRCAWCQSIHGPSAYLVDLLHWMSARTRPLSLSAGPETALDALLARRPDLGELPLTCENVERVLPMIDLTMEILEAKVVGASELPANSSESTTEEQLAGPQHINDAAYTILGDEDATTSFLTPFHRPLVEARAFLGQLGVTRLALMEAFATTHSLTALQLATERLGLSAE
ncbi:MAG: hypothetical protein IPO67_04625, partial [Deltaproteobacteria bacterium]|nr:hypothetical protein [Deltaproteobacteria bacterium]